MYTDSIDSSSSMSKGNISNEWVKVNVRQHNSGAVEDFILSYSAVYLRIRKWKNYWNRSTFAKVIVKIKVVPFYGLVSKTLQISMV